MEYWKQRYNARLFDETQSVKAEDFQAFLTIIEHSPTQRSLNDHVWFALEPEHRPIKQWLVENIHNCKSDMVDREYMLAVLTAPVVFFSIVIDSEALGDPYRNIGIAAGAVAVEAQKRGYQTSFIGCTEHYIKSGNLQHRRQVNRELIDRLNSEFSNRWIQELGLEPNGIVDIKPNLSLCIGTADPTGSEYPEDSDSGYSEYQGYAYYKNRKYHKPWSGLVTKKAPI